MSFLLTHVTGKFCFIIGGFMHLKNIPHEEVLVLAEQLPVHKGQIISKTLVQNQFVGMTLFSFSAEEEIIAGPWKAAHALGSRKTSSVSSKSCIY